MELKGASFKLRMYLYIGGRRSAQAGLPDSARPTRGQEEAAGNGGGGP